MTPYNDDGKPINAYWCSKMLDFNVPERYKIINRIFYSLKPSDHTSCKLYVRTDRKDVSFVDLKRGDKLIFLIFDFTRFSFKASDVQQEMSKKLKEKKGNTLPN
ncbi:hypothetical protein [Bacillus sp. JJ1562]|uniref:hypothetical protein n=1 Tax=Bacillus sp. JJ1562 TaxID=3122960 RepID=UPI0030025DC0